MLKMDAPSSQIGNGGKPLPGTGIEQVQLSYAPGKTTLTKSLDQTTYIHAVGNELRLFKVTGVGCASCGESNVQYSYDNSGGSSKPQLSPEVTGI